MKYDHFTMLPERAFQPRNGRMSMTFEGGGGAVRLQAPLPNPTSQSGCSLRQRRS
jgi:hypothetical protein